VYVREKGIITLEDATRKTSSFPAARIGILDRGVLRAGMKADIAAFRVELAPFAFAGPTGVNKNRYKKWLAPRSGLEPGTT